jgi:hypothetical protein
MNQLEGGNPFSMFSRKKNQPTQAEIDMFGGPNTAEKAEQYFAAPNANSESDKQIDELSDDERISSFTSKLTPDMTTDERLPGLIDTLRSMQDDKNFVMALNSLPPNVIKKLPMDIIGRRGRLGGGKSKRRKNTKRKRQLKRTLKRKGGKGKGGR